MKGNFFPLLFVSALLLILGACNPKQTGTNGNVTESGMTSTSTITQEVDTSSTDVDTNATDTSTTELIAETTEEDTNTTTEESETAEEKEEPKSEEKTDANVANTPAPKKEAPKPTPKKEESKPAPKKEEVKPEPAYQPSPKPTPTPTPQSKPTPPQAKPTPKPVQSTTTNTLSNSTTQPPPSTTPPPSTPTARPIDSKVKPSNTSANKPTSRPKTTLEQAMESKNAKPTTTKSPSSGRATITLTSGGGFAGATTTFQIRPDGKVIKTNSLKPNASEVVKTLGSNELTNIYQDLDKLQLQNVKFSHPGNMTYSLKVESDAYKNNVRWGSNDHQVPANIQQYYDNLMKMIGN